MSNDMADQREEGEAGEEEVGVLRPDQRIGQREGVGGHRGEGQWVVVEIGALPGEE